MKKCSYCSKKLEDDDFIQGIKGDISCYDCESDKMFDVSELKGKKLENALKNFLDYGIKGEYIGQGEGRIVYDLEQILKIDYVLKEKSSNKIEGVNYQNFVEKYIFNKSNKNIQENVLGKIIAIDSLDNGDLIMEKCVPLDECFFSGIDLRNKEEFDKYVDIENYKFNDNLIFDEIKKHCDKNICNDFGYNKLSKIGNIDFLYSVSKMIIVSNFFDQIYESVEEFGFDYEKLKEELETYYDSIVPKEIKYLIDEFQFTAYDIFRGDQWGISKIDSKFKLIDYGMGLKSKDFYDTHFGEELTIPKLNKRKKLI